MEFDDIPVNHCGNCKAYDKRTNQCRKNAPVQDHEAWAAWPMTFNTGWCLEHVSKED